MGRVHAGFNRRWFLATVVWTGLAMPAAAASEAAGAKCPDLLSARYALLDQELRQDEIRIRWASQGPHGLEDTHDANGNGAPDVIEDLLVQLVTARETFVEGLKLAHPLRQERYQVATAITVFVMDLARGNGLAFDEVTRLPEIAGHPGQPCSLVAVVSRRIDFSRNVTGAHELFHLFQYGYTMFKAGWMLEGMARWIETVFAGSVPVPAVTGPAPLCQEATQARYGASRYWAARWRAAGEDAMVPAGLAEMTYLNGHKVLAGMTIHGGGAIRPDLEALARLSARVSATQGLPQYAWPEATQRSAGFNDEMCVALQ